MCQFAGEQVGGKLDSSMFWWLGNTQVNLTDLDQFISYRAYLNHICVLQWTHIFLFVDWMKPVEVHVEAKPSHLESLGMRYDFIYELEAG